MTTALSSTLNSADTAQAPILPGSAEAKNNDAHSAATDFLQIESIVLNLDASLRVHARAHFFSWTQGLLQSLIRHELLICTLCLGKPPAFRADGFSMTTPEPNLFSDMFLRDTGVAPALLKAWEERRYQPVVLDLNAQNTIGAGGFQRELDILKWIYLGKSNFEIGAILKISPLTVKNHVQKILRKLNVVNRTQAIGKALELRILNP